MDYALLKTVPNDILPFLDKKKLLCVDACGDTLLHLAIRNDDDAIMTWLLTIPELINAQNNFGHTAVHYAVKYGRHDMLNKLLSITYINLKLLDHDNLTPLTLACSIGNIEIINLLLMRNHMFPEHEKDKALILTISHGFFEITRWLLKSKNFNINALDSDNNNLLQIAILNRCDKAIALFLSCNPDHVNTQGKTASMLAEEWGHQETIKLITHSDKLCLLRDIYSTVGKEDFFYLLSFIKY